MKNRLVLLILMAVVPAFPVYSQPLPAAYKEAVSASAEQQVQRERNHQFRYQFYAMYDRHVPAERFLPLLAPQQLEMRFPETALRSHADFKRWYAGIGKAITSNTHTPESVKVSVLGGGRYQADIVGVWQAESKKGEYFVFKFRQQWSLVDGPGKQPLIQTYLVEAAE